MPPTSGRASIAGFDVFEKSLQETNGSARRLVDGLPPMLSPFPRYIVLCGLDGRRQVPLEAQLSPALTGGAFSVRRVGFPTQQQMASRPVDAAGLLVV